MRFAVKQGRNPDDLVQDAVAQYFDHGARLAEGLNHGEVTVLRVLPVPAATVEGG